MKSADDNSETVKTLNVKTIRCNGKSKPIENGVEDSSSNFDYEDGMAEGEKEVNGNSRCSSRMNGILEEFTELYNEKLIRINKLDDDEKLKRKVRVLECWVNDLAEQNQILVSTVEELEKEASRRVFLLQEKLDKMALVTRESCVSLRDHQVQVSVLLKQKLSAEDETEALRTKVLHLEATNNSLLKENADLRRELEASEHGRDCRVSLQEPSNENLLLKDSSLTFTSNSSLEDEIEVGRLKSELEELKKSQREANLTLTQRDQHIASLQAQLTDLHRKLSAAQAQVHNTTSTLHSLMDRGRHDSFEIIRRDDVIRQLLSPSRRMIKFGGGDIPIAAVDDGLPKPDVEAELSENIDLLASRLRELEEECERLRARNDGVEMEGHHSHKPSPNSISLSDRTRASSSQRGVVGSISRETQTSEMVVTCETQEAETKAKRKDSKEEVDVFKLARLENELSEKNILIRELQNHLVLSREELRLKDETLCNVEQKLECSRRNYDEKEERMLYLTSQLTNLQLEVSRLHGNTQRLRLQLENKSELVLKLECENRSLVRQLNDKSSVFEGIQKELSNLETQLESKNKQVSEQKLTIGSLQDALVTAKINLDKLQSESVSKSISSSVLTLPFGRMDRTPLKTCDNHFASQLSATLPDVRSSFDSHASFHNINNNNNNGNNSSNNNSNCPEVDPFSCVESLDTKRTSPLMFRGRLDDFLRYESTNDPNLVDGRSSSEPTPGVGATKGAFLTAMTEATSSSREVKSPAVISPTDSGIGSEDFISPSSADPKEEESASKKIQGSTFGRIFMI